MDFLKTIADEQPHIGVWRFYVSDNCITLNEKLMQIFDLPLDFEFTIETLHQFYSGVTSGERIKKVFLAALTTGEPFYLETEIVTAKLKFKRVRTIGFADIADGKCSKLFGIIHDITAQGY